MFVDIIVISDDDRCMRYPGGKGKCYQRLINLMPPHQTYIETHLGAGAVLRHKKPAARNIGIDIDPAVHSLWQEEGHDESVELVQADAVEYLSSFPFTGDELVYADPPYVTETRRRSKIYRFEYDDQNHCDLLSLLVRLPCMVMISGYDNPLYAEILQSWTRSTFTAKTHTGLREECVWMNFPPSNVLHDTRYLGHTFRERQTIARRQERLREKIRSMDSIERNDLVRWMVETYGSVQEVG
ncbi:DNA adenine methylase [Pseudomonas aeruginosa]